MTYPDIKSFHEDRWLSSMAPRSRRRFFMGQPIQDLYFKKKKPNTNFSEEETHFVLEVALPGYSKEEILVTVIGNKLTVRGEKNKSKDEQGTSYIIREFDMDMTERVFMMTEGISEEHIEAAYKNGILILRFRKTPSTEKETNRNILVL